MRICITGGAGYVGTALTKRLADQGHVVTVLDTFWFGDHLPDQPEIIKIKGDIRNSEDLARAFKGQEAAIHLACVSNDPSFDMNPKLGKAINYDCFQDLIRQVNEAGIERFIYASSSSVYGVSELDKVTENAPKQPLTDYSRYKYGCEVKLAFSGTGGTWTIVRPATVCGYSPRQRLDLVVNILTIQALINNRMTVHGGQQTRPNIHINDMCDAYSHILNQDPRLVHQQTYNVGFENASLMRLAEWVREIVGGQITVEDVIDLRSYRVDSEKIAQELGFRPSFTIKDAIRDLKNAYLEGYLGKDPMANTAYNNIKRMKELNL